MKPNHVLSGCGCKMCWNERRHLSQRKSHEEFLKEIGDSCSVLEKYKGAREKIKFKCKKGRVFDMRPNDILYAKHGCPLCATRVNSKGVQSITSVLENMKLMYFKEQSFSDCRNPRTNYLLPFDFFIPELNLIIEYDGEFHYKVPDSMGGSIALKGTKYRDSVKNEYCLSKKIHLKLCLKWVLLVHMPL